MRKFLKKFFPLQNIILILIVIFSFVFYASGATVYPVSSTDTINTWYQNYNNSINNLNTDKIDTASSTDNLSEGSSNLYWTNARFDARLIATTSLHGLLVTGYVDQNVKNGSSPTFLTPTISGMVWDGITLATSSDILALWDLDDLGNYIDYLTFPTSSSATQKTSHSIYVGSTYNNIFLNAPSGERVNLSIDGVPMLQIYNLSTFLSNKLNMNSNDIVDVDNLRANGTTTIDNYVGIGTTSPVYDLDVDGDIRGAYYSSDGTAGWTGTCEAASSTIVKDGIITGCN